MDRRNIKNVDFHFELSSVVQNALENSGNYRPSFVANYMCHNYTFQTAGVADRDVRLCMTFPNDRKDSFTILAFEEIDYDAPDCDFNRVAEMLEEIEISVPKIVGAKNWAYYLDHKFNFGTTVQTPAEAKTDDLCLSNFHDFLAEKLQKGLHKKGLIHIDAQKESVLADISMERRLIGMMIDYREMCLKPQTLSRRLNLS